MPSHQIEYCRNFIFKRHFPIHKIFERSCEIGLWRLTANRISEIFGVRLTKRLRGKLGTVIEQIEHGHHVFRAYWKNAFLKQYEKFSTLPAQRTVLQQPERFRLEEGLGSLAGRAREVPGHHRPLRRLSRLNGSTSTWTFPCCSGSLCPSPSARCAIPASRSTRPGSSACWRCFCTAAATVGGWTAKADSPGRPHHLRHRREILRAEPTPLRSPQAQGPRSAPTRRPPLRLPPHRQRPPGRALCSCSSTSASAARWPTAASITRPTAAHRPDSKLEAAYHKADKAIQEIVDLLAA